MTSSAAGFGNRPNLRLVMRTVIVFLIACYFLTPVKTFAQEPCMSDTELRGYLAQAALFGLGRSAAGCMRFPSFRDHGPKYLEEIATVTDAYAKKNYSRAMLAYNRAFGSQADKIFERQIEAAAAGYKIVPQYNESECNTYLNTLEGISLAGADVIETLLVIPIFSTARQRIAICKNN